LSCLEARSPNLTVLYLVSKAAEISQPEEILDPKATNNKPILTKEERRKRELLLKTYGYDVDEIVEGEDGEAEILYKGASDKPALSGMNFFSSFTFHTCTKLRF
jgi:hypothetical protein